ncbi:MAG: hypothetical protein HQ495_10130 [Alphaproteobacteria bacterium]|nr:hypothetical protein [Alphaproteobacteria bacterium]
MATSPLSDCPTCFAHCAIEPCAAEEGKKNRRQYAVRAENHFVADRAALLIPVDGNRPVKMGQ